MTLPLDILGLAVKLLLLRRLPSSAACRREHIASTIKAIILQVLQRCFFVFRVSMDSLLLGNIFIRHAYRTPAQLLNRLSWVLPPKVIDNGLY